MKALFVVEQDFLTKHVGVARVILYYAQGLIDEGVQVDFAFPNKGVLLLGRIEEKKFKVEGNENTIPLPWYSTDGISSKTTKPFAGSSAGYSIFWSNDKANVDDYDLNLVTAPWVGALGLPPLPRMVGIIYDLVPNLVIAGCIRLIFSEGLLNFCQEHDAGLRYFLANAEKILCISEATRHDFLEMYETAPRMADSIYVDIPYTYQKNPSTYSLPIKFENKYYASKPTVLLVNALDLRKNLKNIEAVLNDAAHKQPYNLWLVGQERMPMPDVLKFFSGLETAGVNVIWWRYADDKLLNTCYQQANLLLFPSLYEGLGLPILEMQNMGKPVITSNISACPEVNLNKSLCFDSGDVDGMTNALISCLSAESEFTAGVELQDMLSKLFANRSSFRQRLNLIKVHE